MTHSQPQPEQTVAEILEYIDNNCIGVEPHTNRHGFNYDLAQAALNRQALATALRLIGKFDPTGATELSGQLRQAFTDYYGGGE